LSSIFGREIIKGKAEGKEISFSPHSDRHVTTATRKIDRFLGLALVQEPLKLIAGALELDRFRDRPSF
jgi:hypothetical protein